MDDLRERAREAMQRLGRRGRTSRIPDDVREAVLAYAKRERARKVGWAEIAKEVGVSGSVLIRWTPTGGDAVAAGSCLCACSLRRRREETSCWSRPAVIGSKD